MSNPIFKSLSHVEFILCVMWGFVLISLICMPLSKFPNTTCWRDCIFSIVYSCFLCQRLIKLGLWVYFWVLRPILLIHMSVFVPVPCCFDYCSSLVLSDIWEAYASCFVLFLRFVLAILCLLCFHLNFRIICSYSVKNVMGNLLRITLDSITILTMLTIPIQEHWTPVLDVRRSVCL